ncbi:MAG: hypothetical protein MJE68_19690, partial [Proteobacteria bacterium]|nr:hypothetical protein [Pseudomonadota bacterium]
MSSSNPSSPLPAFVFSVSVPATGIESADYNTKYMTLYFISRGTYISHCQNFAIDNYFHIIIVIKLSSTPN